MLWHFIYESSLYLKMMYTVAVLLPFFYYLLLLFRHQRDIFEPYMLFFYCLMNSSVPPIWLLRMLSRCLFVSATKRWAARKDKTIIVWFAFITVNLHVFWSRKYVWNTYGNDMRFDVPHTRMSRIAHLKKIYSNPMPIRVNIAIMEFSTIKLQLK